MARKGEREFSSLKWIHRVREEHYRKTKDLPLEAWLQPVDPETTARACRKLGLKVRVAPAMKRKMRQRA
jgi:hypothetical protein